MGNQILGSDKHVKINDFPLSGMVQSFDWSPSFNAQDIFELGNDAKVASALELETSGSFELLSVGGSAGMLARMIVHRNAGTGAFEGYEFDQILDTGTSTVAATTTTWDGLTGATINAYTGKSLLITAGTNVGLRRTIVSNTATDVVTAAFPVANDATSAGQVDNGPNGFVFTQSALKECNFDIVSYIKSDQINWDRAVALPRAFLTSIAGRADANGTASETYNFTGDFVMGVVAPYHNLRAVPATRTGPTTATLVDTTIASTSHKLAYFYLDARRLRTTAGDGIYATLGAAGLVTLTGVTIDATAKLGALVWDDTTTTNVFPAVTAQDRATSAFFVRGYQADIYIAPADADNPAADEAWLKVQSIDWNVDLRTEALRQIAYNSAGTSVYCRLPSFPLNVTANISAYEADWKDWLAMLDPAIKPFGATGTDVYGESYDFSPNSLLETFAVVIQYRTKTGTLLQTWKFTDMRVDGSGARVNVGGRSEISWSLAGTAFSIEGFNV